MGEKIKQKQLLYDPKETRGYWELKDEGLDRTIWRTQCGCFLQFLDVLLPMHTPQILSE